MRQWESPEAVFRLEFGRKVRTDRIIIYFRTEAAEIITRVRG